MFLEIHAAAKETVALAEQRFMSNQHEWQFDNAWQEMLNHATIKVMDAENQKAASGREHQLRATLFNAAEQKVSVNYVWFYRIFFVIVAIWRMPILIWE